MYFAFVAIGHGGTDMRARVKQGNDETEMNARERVMRWMG